MGRPSLMERYFAQCQSHRSTPRPEFVAGLRDGVMEVNFAEVPLADIRLFAYAVLDSSPASGPTRPPAPLSRRLSGRPSPRGGASDSGTSSPASTAGVFAHTHFVTLHFAYDLATPAAAPHRSSGARPSPSAPTPLLAGQNEATLRCVQEAVALAVKENSATLASFAWCDMPLTTPTLSGGAPPQRGGSGARPSAPLTHTLPLCHRLTSLRLDGVPLTRAQFMQLTMLPPTTSAAAAGSGGGGVSWPALEEASFSRCGLTDTCRNGLAHLIRVAVPLASGSAWQRSLRGGYADPDDRPLPRPTGSGISSLSRGAARGLKRLDVSQNPLGDETARAVAAAIPGSALRYLNMSGTSVTWEGGSSLASPSVLDDTAMELVDMSSTGVCAMLSPAGGAAEAKMLSESSIAAGFRVVARGMGQLLILREAARAPQQPWLMRTAAAPQRPPSPTADRPRGEAPWNVPAATALGAGSVAAAAVAPLPHPDSAAVSRAESRFGLSSTHVTSPPAPAASAPSAGAYGPWWPMFASWYAASAAHPGAAPGPAAAPGDGYVPVPVPFPMFAPMPMAFPPVAQPPTSPAPPPPPLPPLPLSTAAGAPSAPLERRATSPLSQTPRAATTPAGVAHGMPGASAGEFGDGADGDGLTGGLAHPLDSELAASPTPSDAASASGDLVHRASEAAGDRKFLVALISRLESHEADVTERLETQYQRTTAQLTSLEKDMRYRLQQIADADRKERTAAADRQAALLEAFAALRAEPAAMSADDMAEAVLPQLVRLIEVGMEKMQAAMRVDDGAAAGGVTSQRHRTPPPRLRFGSADVLTESPASSDRDVVKTASERLRQLGW
ncbi:hypothetical protein NESM_000102100 [Novymonas esmeraldas]|uniref:Uncharacterized protein n=1 Tax=Novymonas esmeraldas TaxID=1808958 RepID=A0AAW0F5E6_9TRYP